MTDGVTGQVSYYRLHKDYDVSAVQAGRSVTKFRLCHLRLKPNLLKRFNLICPVQSHLKKLFAFAVGQIISTSPPRLVSQEGRLAIVTDVENGMRWTRQAQDERR
jgi:hypothetical protein